MLTGLSFRLHSRKQPVFLLGVMATVCEIADKIYRLLGGDFVQLTVFSGLFDHSFKTGDDRLYNPVFGGKYASWFYVVLLSSVGKSPWLA
jgi:hypothetical protein